MVTSAVVRRRRSWSCRHPDPAWATRYDLRVEDHRAPLDELARLLRIARAYEAFDRASEAAEAGDLAAAAASMDEARVLAPEDDQIALWAAVFFGGAGRMDEASACSPRLAGQSHGAPSICGASWQPDTSRPPSGR